MTTDKSAEAAPHPHPAVPAAPSAKRLRMLLRASPLVAPELRAHWLRILPHLSAEQRAELADLLEASEPAGRAPDPAHARRP
jgi:hypothetical protein